MQTTGIVKAEYDACLPHQKPVAINVDVIGIGSGVVDRLKEMGLPAVGINVAEAEAVNDRADRQFNRLRDELWWRGREWLEARDCKFADDDETIAELTTPTYKILSSGLIQVERKDELKARGVKSPNRADAWLLTLADTTAPKHWKPLNINRRFVR
jgi:phage terminase large subunit